jgi:glutaredoxin 2
MAAALKGLHLQETVVLEDDSETMFGLVGKRRVPILIKDDGQPMLESMDMVAYIDNLGAPILVGPQRSELAEWASATADKSAPLTWPRPEFDTIAAHDHYVVRKRERLGDFVELRAKTREYIEALMPELETLDRLIESPTAVNGKLSLDDIRVLPLLRSAAVVKGLRFPQKVRNYFVTMMARIGYQPLPAV